MKTVYSYSLLWHRLPPAIFLVSSERSAPLPHWPPHVKTFPCSKLLPLLYPYFLIADSFSSSRSLLNVTSSGKPSLFTPSEKGHHPTPYFLLYNSVHVFHSTFYKSIIIFVCYYYFICLSPCLLGNTCFSTILIALFFLESLAL